MKSNRIQKPTKIKHAIFTSDLTVIAIAIFAMAIIAAALLAGPAAHAARPQQPLSPPQHQ